MHNKNNQKFQQQSQKKSQNHSERAFDRSLHSTSTLKKRKKPAQFGNSGRYWIFGRHAVNLALENPRRKVYKLLVSSKIREEISANPQKFIKFSEIIQVVSTQDLLKSTRLSEDVPHQGIAALVAPLEQPSVEELFSQLTHTEAATVILLDKLSDPHNIGAILRSCAAFGVSAVITTQDGSPDENGIIAKSASGALELVPYIKVVNLARTLRLLQENHFFTIGFSVNTDKIIEKDYFERHKGQRLALVFGNEESGLRRLTQENCDDLVKIALHHSPVDSLNVSNAVAVALYQNLLTQK